MKYFSAHIIIGSATLLVPLVLGAQPLLGNSFILQGQTLFRDSKKPELYYYIPFGFRLAADASGKPGFSLTQMRYTGTNYTGDIGVYKYNNLLQIRLVTDPGQNKIISSLLTELRRTNASATLQMLPVRKFASLLVFAPADEPGATDSVGTVKPDLDEPTDENAAVNNSYWTERTISLRLSNADAELMIAALKNGQKPMSFSYAFYTVFADQGTVSSGVTGDGRFRKQVNDFFQNELSGFKDTTQKVLMIKADAIPLAVDLGRWPALLRQVDINERLPARYPLFDVYCYDFKEELRTDLFEKKIELKVTAVNNREISMSYSFRENRPDEYARSIHFPYAVKFDKPVYYQVTEFNHDGDQVKTEWLRKETWSGPLNITSPPEKQVRKGKQTETDQ